MVRYALAIAGQPANEASRIDLSLEVVDIMNCGQLDETFLCEINPKGQVRRPCHYLFSSSQQCLPH